MVPSPPLEAMRLHITGYSLFCTKGLCNLLNLCNPCRLTNWALLFGSGFRLNTVQNKTKQKPAEHTHLAMPESCQLKSWMGWDRFLNLLWAWKMIQSLISSSIPDLFCPPATPTSRARLSRCGTDSHAAELKGPGRSRMWDGPRCVQSYLRCLWKHQAESCFMYHGGSVLGAGILCYKGRCCFQDGAINSSRKQPKSERAGPSQAWGPCNCVGCSVPLRQALPSWSEPKLQKYVLWQMGAVEGITMQKNPMAGSSPAFLILQKRHLWYLCIGTGQPYESWNILNGSDNFQLHDMLALVLLFQRVFHGIKFCSWESFNSLTFIQRVLLCRAAHNVTLQNTGRELHSLKPGIWFWQSSPFSHCSFQPWKSVPEDPLNLQSNFFCGGGGWQQDGWGEKVQFTERTILPELEQLDHQKMIRVADYVGWILMCPQTKSELSHANFGKFPVLL